ncbi:MAG: tetratricopeptide repeat protein [Candidatus Marinimicrobia bacterium]|nr:tetratricopeptide repeat protein [Candidatus Neomarinimicrobiota bacterium]MBL7022966.1 tetratricopeptide repeat protein [Candidatus Neomarinimicrobiota bacterium]MBL7108784.1 tetratricopeptide repeat protein [Candidatus Neomarinimicrobiota bacterium]
MRKYFILFILSAIIQFGCNPYSDDNYLYNPPDTYVNLMVEGWGAYVTGDFDIAIEAFQSAADRDATKPEPYLGLGWSYARTPNLESAKANFSKTLAFSDFDDELGDTLLAETYAGMAYVFMAEENCESAIEYSQNVIGLNPTFQMRYDVSINIDRLELMELICNFNLHSISEAYLMAKDMGGEFTTVFQQINGQATVEHIDNTELTGEHKGILQEVFEDVNEDCVYDSLETFTDANNNNLWDIVNESYFLIYVESVLLCSETPDSVYSVLSIDEGTNTFYFQENPIIPNEDTIIANYYYVEDYGLFLNELLAILSSLNN